MKPSGAKVGLAVIIIAAVCVAVAVTHWPALSADALSFDDQQYLTKNVLVQNPGWMSAKRFLTEVLDPSTIRGYYQPLSMISLMLDYATGGRGDNLRPFHATSLTLHTANTALITVLLYLLFGNIWAAAAAGLLFGVHPMTVELLPWVGERKTLLAAFFSFWSLIFYVRYARNGGWKAYTCCFVMYLLALMSKPTSVPLPLVMLLMDYWPLNRLKARSVLEKLPLFILGAVFAIITYVSQSRTAGTILPTQFGPEYTPLVLCHNIIFYLYKIILPINLSSHYAFPKPFGLSNAMVLAGVIGTCILIPLLLVSLRWTRAALTGWLIFFVAILPTMGVVEFTNVIASDRFVYLPSIGLLIAVTSFLLWLGKNNKLIIILTVIVLMMVGAEAVATQRYLVCWQDSVTLYNHMLTLTPNAALLYNNRGFAYNEEGEYDLAISDFNKALEINPRYAEAYYNRGNTYARGKGVYDLAIADYSKAIEINPKFVNAYDNRGNTFKSKGELDNAISDYTKATEINPADADAYNNRGAAYYSKGQLDHAISDYNKALEIDPEYLEVYFNKALACEIAGRKAEAVEAYKAFIRYAPVQYTPYIEQARKKIKDLER